MKAENVQLNLLLERSGKIRKDVDNEKVVREENEKHLNEEIKTVETMCTAELQTLEVQRTEVLSNIQTMLDEHMFELNLNSVKQRKHLAQEEEKEAAELVQDLDELEKELEKEKGM